MKQHDLPGLGSPFHGPIIRRWRSSPTTPSTASSFPAPSSSPRWARPTRTWRRCCRRLLMDAGHRSADESVSWKHSSNGKYVSVRIAFRADSARAVRRRAPGAARASGSEVDAVSVAAAPDVAVARTVAARPRTCATSAASPTSRSGARCRRFTDARDDDTADELWLVEHDPGVHPRPGRQARARADAGRYPGAARRPRRPGDLPRPRPDRGRTRCST